MVRRRTAVSLAAAGLLLAAPVLTACGSEPAHPGAAVSGNDNLPAVTAAPPAGLSPPDTLGVQSVAVCMELFGCDVGTPVDDGAAEGFASIGSE